MNLNLISMHKLLSGDNFLALLTTTTATHAHAPYSHFPFHLVIACILSDKYVSVARCLTVSEHMEGVCGPAK